MARVVRIQAFGGPENLKLEQVDVAAPGPGQARIRQTAIGLNYLDVYHRTGLYPIGDLPAPVGSEGAGVVEAVGEGVTSLKAGDRVAYVGGPLGAYADERLYPADRLVPLPDWVSDEQAASLMMQGLTAQYLLRRTFPVQSGQTILFHAAAGGVGLIACQWAKSLGARVLGTVGSKEKADLAVAHGCDVPIFYREANWVQHVRQETDEKGVPVVYDSVGKDTIKGSFECLAPLGTLVVFGQSSGPVPPIELGQLAKGSFFLTRPSIAAYMAARSDLMQAAAEVFELVKNGTIKVNIAQRFKLEDAAEAHRALEARKTTGSTLLIP
ncbi:quinone oxidoreductase family protein [Roseiterribacter gracilis]|uniref:Quinone oxidoreductase n=1 Tax=Roseiterribacter gracilis TaxID=2812848 RepID=A0A8S8XGY3_9PROT|nr:quinone oxidoreductase [Rhodospirillales bacterium TMPK1]